MNMGNDKLFKIIGDNYLCMLCIIKSGLCWGMYKYFKYYRKFDYKILDEFLVKNPIKYKITAWRYGNEADGAFRRYYIGVYNNKKIFVKIATNDLTVQNEINIARYINNDIQPFLCTIRFYSIIYNTCLIAFDYYDNLEDFKNPSEYKDFETLCSEYLEILKYLEKKQIIHGDIHKGNLLLDSNGKLILLDFGISFINKKQVNINYKVRKGTYFRELKKGKKIVRVYDDAYSFIKMTDTFSFPKEWKQSIYYRKILERIDMNHICIELSDI